MNRRSLLTTLGLAPVMALPTMPAIASQAVSRLPEFEIFLRKVIDAVFSDGHEILWFKESTFRNVIPRVREAVHATGAKSLTVTSMENHFSLWRNQRGAMSERRAAGSLTSASRRESAKFISLYDDDRLRAESDKREGCIFKLFAKRTQTYVNGKVIVVSDRNPPAGLAVHMLSSLA